MGKGITCTPNRDLVSFKYEVVGLWHEDAICGQVFSLILSGVGTSLDFHQEKKESKMELNLCVYISLRCLFNY